MLGEGENIKTETSELAKANVIGEVLEQTRGPKLTIFKKKRRHNYRRKKGHKQDLTLVRIKSIGIGKTKSSKKEEVDLENSKRHRLLNRFLSTAPPIVFLIIKPTAGSGLQENRNNTFLILYDFECFKIV